MPATGSGHQPVMTDRVLTLLAPAIWNGFPLLQYDTGGYLARWFEGYLVPSRSVVYGLFVALLWFRPQGLMGKA